MSVRLRGRMCAKDGCTNDLCARCWNLARAFNMRLERAERERDSLRICEELWEAS